MTLLFRLSLAVCCDLLQLFSFPVKIIKVLYLIYYLWVIILYGTFLRTTSRHNTSSAHWKHEVEMVTNQIISLGMIKNVCSSVLKKAVCSSFMALSWGEIIVTITCVKVIMWHSCESKRRYCKIIKKNIFIPGVVIAIKVHISNEVRLKRTKKRRTSAPPSPSFFAAC